MTHGHAHHDHAHLSDARDGALWWAVAVNGLLTVAQVVGGLLSGSLALMADALHNLSDAGALVLALVARRVARRPADASHTFGYRRAEVVGALINLTVLVVLGIFLAYEGVVRLFVPQPVAGWLVVQIAALALLVDVATALLTLRLARESINVRAAFLHNVADALTSVGVIVAGSLIILYDFYLADALATLAIAGYVTWQALGQMRTVVGILMNSAPVGFDFEGLVADLRALPEVTDVHHVHLWQMDEHHSTLEAHVVLEQGSPARIQASRVAVKALLKERYGIGHSTLEFEFVDVLAGEEDHDEGVIAHD